LHAAESHPPSASNTSLKSDNYLLFPAIPRYQYLDGFVDHQLVEDTCLGITIPAHFKQRNPWRQFYNKFILTSQGSSFVSMTIHLPSVL